MRRARRPSQWSTDLKAVWPYAASSTILLFGTACLAGWFVTWQRGGPNFNSYVLAAADPALAALAMMLVCAAQPAVFSGRRYRLPHTLTLPTLYMGVIVAAKLLGREAGTTIQQYPGVGRFDLIWLSTEMVFLVWIGTVVLFGVVGAFVNDARRSEKDAP